jgi:hypothetical protein
MESKPKEEKNKKPKVNKKNNKVTDKKICEKCLENSSKIYNRNKFLCLNCFDSIIIHKFKSNLRTCCKIRQEDYLLVCISGGNYSMGMLELFHQSFNDSNSKRKLFFKIKILYIDDSILLKEKEKIIEERQKRKLFLDKKMKEYKFDYDIIYLEKVMNLNDIKINLTDNNEYDNILIEKYLKIFESISNTGGFKTKFIQISINNLIFFYTLKNKFTKIVFGNNGQGLVRQSFFNIITGNGKDIKHNITHVDDTYLNGKIIIYRPLQDFFDKEISYFNHYHKVEIIYPVYKDDNLTKILSTFFGKLQFDRLNTVPSVINTAEKVAVYKSEKICKFCLSYLDKNKNKLEFGLDAFLNDENCTLNNELCYGCRRMFSDLIQDFFIEDKKEKSILIINEILNMFKCLL